MPSFSKKLQQKILSPHYVGNLEERPGMRLVIGKEGELKTGNCIAFYWLIDESDGVISDVKFQAFGPPSLIGAGEIAAHLLLRKHYDQARRISADLIDRQARDKSDISAFPDESALWLNMVIFAIDSAVEQCLDLPPLESYTSPIASEADSVTQYPHFSQLTRHEKLKIIEELMASEVRPYVQLDAGDVKVINFLEPWEVIISYEGACTTCLSATGTTLSAIQHILRTKVHPSLVVIPQFPLPTE